MTEDKNIGAFEWIKGNLAAKRTVYLSRQFYNGTKHIKVTPKRVGDLDWIFRFKDGKLQVREGKSYFDVLGHYRVTAQ
jgi:hypothetical protein